MKTTFRLTGLRATLNRLREFGVIDALPAFEEVGLYVIARLLQRTAAGRDVRGRFFKGYTPRYKAWRAEKGLPTRVVDLFVTGSMLGSVDSKAEPTRVTVFVRPGTDASDVSNALKAAALNKTRRWFAISQADKDGVLRILEQRLIRKVAG